MLVYVGSYPPDSTGMVKAANEVGLKTKMFGGGMVGLQFAAIQKNLGPLLNNIVNYDFWVPESTLNFPGVKEFLAKYQEAAKGKGVDPYGHYLPPYAYAYLEVLGQAVQATKGLDQDKIAKYIHDHTFKTVVGDVKFGKQGEWAEERTMAAQFQNIKGNTIDDIRDLSKEVIIYPPKFKTGEVIYPYEKAK